VTTRTNPFDRGEIEATAYDSWYDTPAGEAVLATEERCVRQLLESAGRPWLDLGTGTGRFGAALRADLGIDAAPAMAQLAARRMRSVALGVAEALPLREGSLGAAFSVTVFEFLPDPEQALRELARVLRPGGRLVIGFFPRDGAWAAAYVEHGREPDSVFHRARFFTPGEVIDLARDAGLEPGAARSTLFENPGEPPTGRATDGADAHAGFIAIALLKGAAP
jgi:ubiquinone/menaquinone biosynthesis C-methylase UbiE